MAGGIARHHDHPHVRIAPGCLAGKNGAVFPIAEKEIAEQHVELLPRKSGERLAGCGAARPGMAGDTQRLEDAAEQIGLVVNNENAETGGAAC